MKDNSFKLVSSKNILRDLFYFVIAIIITLIIGFVVNISYERFKIKNKELIESLNYCGQIRNNPDNYNIEQIDECFSRLNNSKKSEIKNLLLKEMKYVKQYIILRDEVNSYFINNVLKSDTGLDVLKYFYDENKKLPEMYQKLLIPLIEKMETQYTKINLLVIFVNNMYETDEKEILKENLTREEYNQSVKAYDEVQQLDIKNEYLKYIEKADEYLTNKERIEEERKRQEEIANAWVKLQVPYISQNLNYVFNGCEAASILMGLQYKGYLLDMDIVTYSTNMPKTNDPNTGFYLDIFGKEPTTEAHWIAPSPLREYAISTSGNKNVIDATGWDLSNLSQEIINNNPVVIYLTYDFIEPYNWSKGVPKNLHVQLISGYNTITEQYLITDPYTRWNGTYEFILSKEDIEYLYNTVGKRAIVIR